MLDSRNRDAWNRFRESGLLWWVNRSLHLFGWAIVYSMVDGCLIDVAPRRVGYRGFSPEVEGKGFTTLTRYFWEQGTALTEEVEEQAERPRDRQAEAGPVANGKIAS